MAEDKIKNKGGRPEAIINWDLVENLCAIKCTGEEIAAIIDVDYDTLTKHIKKKYELSFSEYFEQKSAAGNMSLRRAQYQTATVANNPTMQIWLGQQWLGQRNSKDIDLSSRDGSMTPTAIERVIIDKASDSDA